MGGREGEGGGGGGEGEAEAEGSPVRVQVDNFSGSHPALTGVVCICRLVPELKPYRAMATGSIPWPCQQSMPSGQGPSTTPELPLLTQQKQKRYAAPSVFHRALLCRQQEKQHHN